MKHPNEVKPDGSAVETVDVVDVAVVLVADVADVADVTRVVEVAEVPVVVVDEGVLVGEVVVDVDVDVDVVEVEVLVGLVVEETTEDRVVDELLVVPLDGWTDPVTLYSDKPLPAVDAKSVCLLFKNQEEALDINMRCNPFVLKS